MCVCARFFAVQTPAIKNTRKHGKTSQIRSKKGNQSPFLVGFDFSIFFGGLQLPIHRRQTDPHLNLLSHRPVCLPSWLVLCGPRLSMPTNLAV